MLAVEGGRKYGLTGCEHGSNQIITPNWEVLVNQLILEIGTAQDLSHQEDDKQSQTHYFHGRKQSDSSD